jgi:hypothetical protein
VICIAYATKYHYIQCTTILSKYANKTLANTKLLFVDKKIRVREYSLLIFLTFVEIETIDGEPDILHCLLLLIEGCMRGGHFDCAKRTAVTGATASTFGAPHSATKPCRCYLKGQLLFQE